MPARCVAALAELARSLSREKNREAAQSRQTRAIFLAAAGEICFASNTRAALELTTNRVAEKDFGGRSAASPPAIVQKRDSVWGGHRSRPSAGESWSWSGGGGYAFE
jgi:hypothetical protein